MRVTPATARHWCAWRPGAATSDGRGVNHELEEIGRTETMQAAFYATRNGAATAIVCPCGPEVRRPAKPLAMGTQGKTVRRSTFGAANIRKGVPMLIDLYTAARLKLDGLVRLRFRLDETHGAFATLECGETARGVVA